MKTSIEIKISLLTFLILLLGVSGCKKDYLDKRPLGEELSEDFFTTEDGAIRATNAVYNQLRNYQTHVFAFIGITSIASDDADKGSDPGDAPPQGELDNFTVTPGNGLLNEFWTGNYQGIAIANQVIERVPAIEMDETLKGRLISEARFLRAYFYFNLVRTFGRIPLITQIPSSTGEDIIQPQVTTQEAYEFIISQLDSVIPILPEKSAYLPADLGRITKGAAKGLLAKVYMYQENWPEVLRLTNEIISSGEYDLSIPYNVIFTRAGENSRESVFEVNAAVLPQCGGGIQYAEVQMTRGPGGLGWGFNTPSQDLINAYEPNDPRRDATIMFRGETMSDGYQVNAQASNPQYNQKAYPEGNEKNPTCGMGDSGKNIRILRYADIILMNAEAANELGQSNTAVTRINQIRERARIGAPAGTLPDVQFTDQASFRNVIWRERRVELAMENDRFWDLVRQGRAGTVLRALGKNFVDGKNEIMPIPQQQIDISGNVLTQNPNY